MKTFEIYEKYPSTKKSLSDVDRTVTSIKNHLQLDESLFYVVHLGIYEIFINALYHGNKLDASKFVEFHSYIEGNFLTIEITDQGEGFDFSAIPNPLEEENILKDSGRGVFITSHYADSLHFEKTRRGFCATLTFDLEKILATANNSE